MAKKKKYEARSDADRRVRQCERLARLMRTLHLISGKGRWDAVALAEELGCSRRTVHRLLQTLSMAGVPWYYDEKRRAYRVRAGYRFPLLDIGTSKAACPCPKEKEAAEILEQLIQDGEVFATSLNKFLTTLKNSGLSSDR